MSDIYISMGSIVAGIAKEMSEIITDNDIDLESLDYDEIEEQFDIIKGHAMLVTKENEELKKENEELKEQIYGIHDDEMDANGLFDDIEDLKKEIEDLKEICMGMCKQLEDVTKHEISDPDHYYRGIKAVEELKEHLECEEDGYPTSDWFKEKLDFHIKYHFTNEGGEYYENMKDLKEKPNCLDDLIYGSLERIREENKKLKGANEEEEN